MSAPTVVLITGASRGIGKGLATTFLGRDNTTVVAAVRSAASAEPLASVSKGAGSKLVVVEIDSSEEKAPTVAVQELVSKHGIDHLDIVIANAGISTDFSPIAKLPVHVLKRHLEVNAYGPLLLFQAVLPLLQKAAAPAKFVALGSPMGSISAMETRPFPMSAYGVSKAFVHYITRKIHLEHQDIISFSVDPGFVQTDMGNAGAAFFGMKEATTTISDSVNFIVSTVDSATREKTSGHFPTIEGGDFAW
ncbi:Short-chain dehydrogenase/reductase SDR [Macrophomina phaseolina MS6]|uniref:Short-chain dehydrogenase/reductase SDR n=1 Tax=Macrophomina phaseolina (strain MS6) TaxID=1126212 RepID=K2R281_MACPH|nr:Short-chain dehydrogenase/reductase SDR [Macrophomina phaseolina MS6]